MYLHGHCNIGAHTSQLITVFESKSGYDPKKFREESIDDLPLVEEIVERIIFFYNCDIKKGASVGELARRSIEKIF